MKPFSVNYYKKPTYDINRRILSYNKSDLIAFTMPFIARSDSIFCERVMDFDFIEYEYTERICVSTWL